MNQRTTKSSIASTSDGGVRRQTVRRRWLRRQRDARASSVGGELGDDGDVTTADWCDGRTDEDIVAASVAGVMIRHGRRTSDGPAVSRRSTFGWTDARTGRRVDGQTDGRADGRTSERYFHRRASRRANGLAKTRRHRRTVRSGIIGMTWRAF